MHRFLLLLVHFACSIGLNACSELAAPTSTEAELSAVADTVLTLETAFHRDFDNTDCEAALSMVGDREPVVAGGGSMIRSLPELRQVCESIASVRSKAVLDVENVDVHPLSQDAAYVVREGLYTEYDKAGEVGNAYHIIFTSIWHRSENGWVMVHLRESWRDPDTDA